jgi:hypothetical protein
MGLAMDYIAANGLELEDDYQYTAYDGTCVYEKAKATYTISSHLWVTP